LRYRVAIDFSTLDMFQMQHGLFRYVVDLINGFAAIDEPRFSYLVIGSRPEPIAEIRSSLDNAPDRMTYTYLRRTAGRGKYWLTHLQYRPIVHRFGVSLLHCPHGFIPAFPGCPIVCTVHDLMKEMFSEYQELVQSSAHIVGRWLTRFRVNRVIAISNTTAADVSARWEVPKSQIDVVPHGLSPTFASLVGSLSVTSSEIKQELMILSPYNLEPRKCLHTLLKAFAVLVQTCSARLTLYGRTGWSIEREAKFDSSVAALGLSNRIDRIGFIDDAELAMKYSSCDLFVFPSAYEGFGYPVLEAMAFGACVIARDKSAMAEIMGAAGVGVETLDSHALADAMIELALAPERRAQLSRAARERASRYTHLRMARDTLDSYLRVLCCH